MSQPPLPRSRGTTSYPTSKPFVLGCTSSQASGLQTSNIKVAAGVYQLSQICFRMGICSCLFGSPVQVYPYVGLCIYIHPSMDPPATNLNALQIPRVSLDTHSLMPDTIKAAASLAWPKVVDSCSNLLLTDDTTLCHHCRSQMPGQISIIESELWPQSISRDHDDWRHMQDIKPQISTKSGPWHVIDMIE